MGNSLQILYVVNKKLPPSDYRIRYGLTSKYFKVVYCMPEKTEGLSDSSYTRMGFNEGWRLSYLLDFFYLYRYLRTHRLEVDLVHFYTTNLILFGPLVAYFAGVRSLVTLTGFGRIFTSTKFIHKMLRPVYRFLLGISIHRSRRYFFQNRTDLELLSSKYPKQAVKFSFTGSAVDFPLIRKKDFSVLSLRVILIARLMPDKGIIDFMRVAEKLHSSALEFVLIGPPSNGYKDLYQKVIDCNNRGIISFKGECSYEEIIHELARSHIYYFPSCYGEGLSRTMLEAGFALLCPIAYDIPANRDLINGGRGFLLPIGNVGNVVSTLNNLLNDRESLSKNAHSYQEFIEKNYNIKTYSERMDNILLELIARKDVDGDE